MLVLYKKPIGFSHGGFQNPREKPYCFFPWCKICTKPTNQPTNQPVTTSRFTSSPFDAEALRLILLEVRLRGWHGWGDGAETETIWPLSQKRKGLGLGIFLRQNVLGGFEKEDVLSWNLGKCSCKCDSYFFWMGGEKLPSNFSIFNGANQCCWFHAWRIKEKFLQDQNY